jgi:hypothetical protein
VEVTGSHVNDNRRNGASSGDVTLRSSSGSIGDVQRPTHPSEESSESPRTNNAEANQDTLRAESGQRDAGSSVLP